MHPIAGWRSNGSWRNGLLAAWRHTLNPTYRIPRGSRLAWLNLAVYRNQWLPIPGGIAAYIQARQR